jgi:WD repeat-containing protein 23
METGTCTTHVWNGGVEEDEADPKVGTRVNERLEYEESLYPGRPQTRLPRVRTRRFGDDDSDGD